MSARAAAPALALFALVVPAHAQRTTPVLVDPAAMPPALLKVTPPMKVRVIDGRTFADLQNDETFRLFAIDVCTLDQHAELAGQPWPCGVVSTSWLTQATLGQWVLCDRLRALPGVTLARCATAHQPDIAAAMIAQGLAITTHDPEVSAPAEYNQLDAMARRTFQGIWHSQFEMPWVYRAHVGAAP